MSGQPPLALDQTSQGLRGGRERGREEGGGEGQPWKSQPVIVKEKKIQEDRNNQIRHHLKWNIHSDGKASPSESLSVQNAAPEKKHMLITKADVAVSRFNCCANEERK